MIRQLITEPEACTACCPVLDLVPTPPLGLRSVVATDVAGVFTID